MAKVINTDEAREFSRNLGGFRSEKDLCSFIKINAKQIATDCFDEQLTELIEEKRFGFSRFGEGRKPRIDLVFCLKSGRRVGVEVKHPTQAYHQLAASVGQALAYLVLTKGEKNPLDEVVIFSSGYHPIITSVIMEYKLPIGFYIIGRDQFAKLQYEN